MNKYVNNALQNNITNMVHSYIPLHFQKFSLLSL